MTVGRFNELIKEHKIPDDGEVFIIADLDKNTATLTALHESYMRDIKRKDELLLDCLDLAMGVISICENNQELIDFSNEIKTELLKFEESFSRL